MALGVRHVGARAVGLPEVALGVVFVGDGLVVGPDVLPQAAQGVEAAAAAIEGGPAAGGGDGLVDAVAGRVEGVGQPAAVLLDDRGQAVGGVVFEADEAGVGPGELDELADAVVVEAGGLAADAAAGEPAARAVGQGGDQPVGVGRFEEAAVGVVFVVGGEVAEGVGDLPDLAAAAEVAANTSFVDGVVVGGGEVADVGAGAVFDLLHDDAGDAGVVGVGGGPGAGLAGGGVLDGPAGDVAAVVVDHRGLAAGFGDLGRQAEAGVPLGEDLAFGAVGGGGVGRKVGGTGDAGSEAFYTGGLQIAGQVPGVAGGVAVEVGAGGDVAVGVVGDGRGRGTAA